MTTGGLMTNRIVFSCIALLMSLSAFARPAVAGDDFLSRNLRFTTSALESRSGARLNLPVSVPQTLAPLIVEAAEKHGVDPKLVAAVVFRESAFNPKAVSRIGAQGLMQLMPRTAKAMGVRDSFDARQNVMGGTRYLRSMLDEFDGNVDLALAAYNAGPQAVKKYGPKVTQEAVEYVAAIRSFYVTR
jgi:soluble lytic murein transglycosylase-like protein